ncbi:hypothetical protein H0B56_01455 [Haloechinothrix sp. YIM 98757]|uniref:Uncharacterized protein n=1 Tax=Haloechinothrix aidingensis TaxID=2752311 RepID=A0A838A606_9PSEU|nr:hypothetical protein [Haloechinothrix aidingensis]MBA0124205.1 hypothetical protein [Haloechinothrix aidingensis]
MSTARAGGGRLLAAAFIGVVLTTLLPGQAPAVQQRLMAQDSSAPVVPETPTTILASELTLSGLCYDGVVEVPTVDGLVPALKFEASSVDLDDVTLSLPDGPATRIEGPLVEVDTDLGERTTLYLRRLKGKLTDGLLTYEVDYSPENPPPASFPWLTFTDVTIGLYALDGGDLNLPGPSLEAGTSHIPLPPMDEDADDPDGDGSIEDCL